MTDPENQLGEVQTADVTPLFKWHMPLNIIECLRSTCYWNINFIQFSHVSQFWHTNTTGLTMVFRARRYGSLLCFSDDNFSSLIWATVSCWAWKSSASSKTRTMVHEFLRVPKVWRRDPALISTKVFPSKDYTVKDSLVWHANQIAWMVAWFPSCVSRSEQSNFHQIDMREWQAQLDIRLPFDPWDDRLSPGKAMVWCASAIRESAIHPLTGSFFLAVGSRLIVSLWWHVSCVCCQMFCCIENVTIYFEAMGHFKSLYPFVFVSYDRSF